MPSSLTIIEQILNKLLSVDIHEVIETKLGVPIKAVSSFERCVEPSVIDTLKCVLKSQNWRTANIQMFAKAAFYVNPAKSK